MWLMRQAGRYMAAFREYSDRIGFRERSETASIAIELSLQPWRAFQVGRGAAPGASYLSSNEGGLLRAACSVLLLMTTHALLPPPQPHAPDGRRDHVLRHPDPAARAGHRV